MTGRGPLVPVRTSDHEVVPLAWLLERWLAAGVISPDQVDRMTVPAWPARVDRRPGSLLVEVLAYVGGAVILAGCFLLASLFWSDLTAGARLGLVGGAAGLLLLAGAAVPRRLAGTGRRLTAVLWLASTVAWCGAVAILVESVWSGGGLGGESNAVLVAAATTGYAAALWTALRHGLQQAAMMVSGAALAAALAVRLDLPGPPGLAVWLVGLGWAGLGLRGVFRPIELPLALGLTTAVVGAMSTASTDIGMVLVLLTVLGVLGTAWLRRDLVLLGIGSLATMINAPAAVARWFAGSAAAAVTLVLVGAVLVGLSVWLTRRSPAGQVRPGRTAREKRGHGGV